MAQKNIFKQEEATSDWFMFSTGWKICISPKVKGGVCLHTACKEKNEDFVQWKSDSIWSSGNISAK